MRKIYVVFLLTLAFIILGSSLLLVSANKNLSTLLKKRVEKGLIKAPFLLSRFYNLQDYQLVWSEDGLLTSNAFELINALIQADREGLNPQEYHLTEIMAILEEIKNGKMDNHQLVDLDILLTDAYFTYGTHLLRGRIDCKNLFPEYGNFDLVDILRDALAKDRIEESLQNLLPLQPAYGGLREALAWYRYISKMGGWPTIPAGPKLKKGDYGERVALLRKRLLVSGDLEERISHDEYLFDQSLENALKRFQLRHGLEVDGVVGDRTLEALNVPVEERICQLKLNMERFRWLPQDPGGRYIIVNIPDFVLKVIEKERPVLSMRVIVGKQDRQTPVFSDEMTHLVINPSWKIPENIFKNDILPKVRKDSGYLSDQNIRVFEDWGDDAREIPSQLIDWDRVDPETFKYKLKQDPGPHNALGRLKFIFPNEYKVYLHDTPHQQLFADPLRTYSSGCIRIEKPIELAEYLLKDNPGWTGEDILAEIEKGEEKTIYLPEPVPVYLVYWTAWVDMDGMINFRDDIYERDKTLAEAFSKAVE